MSATPILKKDYRADLAASIQEAKDYVRAEFGLSGGNNVDLVCEKIEASRASGGHVVQCGVWQGYTMFVAARFCQQRGIDLPLTGFDSFGGFPDGILHPYDKPDHFKKLYSAGKISLDHFEKASVRTGGFADLSHLTKEYFLDTQEVFERAQRFPRIGFVKGPFSQTMKMFKEKVAILFLDCDLYKSYLECLDALYPRVVPGGSVVFDEYYSLKYPGARAAVDEFFADKKGRFECYRSSEGFERWCFVKEVQA